MKEIVVVVPCYNEEETLPYIIKALNDVSKKLKPQYSIDYLFVNDGSSDKTQEILNAESSSNKNIYFREFSKNAGHQSALRAGINAATHYDAVIMMDADMQHPPELIEKMLNKKTK